MKTSLAPRQAIEALEDRIAPAGLITALFSHGALTVTGDDANNTLTITETADGRLTLTTDIGTGLKVNGTDVVGFMGYTLPAAVSGAVTIDLHGGVDSTTISGVAADIDLPAALTIKGGDGDNLVTFTQGVTIGGKVSIVNGTGMDTIHLNDEITILGKLTIANGAGGSLIDSNAAGDLRVAGLFSVLNGAGQDTLDITVAQKATFGAVTIKNGVDGDGSNIDLSPVQALTVAGPVKITNGAGADTLDIGDPTLVTRIAGSLTINNGAGSNHTDVIGTDSLAVGGAVTVLGGADSDLVHLGINSDLVSFSSITVKPGDGANSVIVTGKTLSVTGNLAVNGGAGVDDIQVLAANDSLISGTAKFVLGGGFNSLVVQGSANGTLALAKTLTLKSTSGSSSSNTVDFRDVKVQGATMLNTGAGNDTVEIDDSSFNGLFVLNTGAGSDKVNVEQLSGLTGHTTFTKPVSILLGAGDDTLKIAGSMPEAERKAIFASSAKFDGGTGTNSLQLVDFVNVFYGPAPVEIGF